MHGHWGGTSALKRQLLNIQYTHFTSSLVQLRLDSILLKITTNTVHDPHISKINKINMMFICTKIKKNIAGGVRKTLICFGFIFWLGVNFLCFFFFFFKLSNQI